jgi:branched-subunit amino acid aminotransferase/4-amino-4-deoxychorismate lyase
MIWVGGRIVADDALRISVLDRTFEHGLGLFETFRTWNGNATLLPRHLDRLSRSAGELGLPLHPSALPGQGDVKALLQADGRVGDAMLRLTLSGGLSELSGSSIWMRTFPLPPTVAAEGLVLGPTAPVRSDPLACHKSLNYWPNRLMYESARSAGFDECLTISPDGKLWEGSRSNLFVVTDGQLLTPPCSGRVLPGIMRGLILERAAHLGLDVREEAVSVLDPLFRPDEVFLSNSVRGIMPVGRWGEARFPAPGPVTGLLWDDLVPWLEAGGTTT